MAGTQTEAMSMGQIVFEEEPPFELVRQKEPIAIADEGFVIRNFAVFAAGYPRATADVQVRITMEQAAASALQLAPAWPWRNGSRSCSELRTHPCRYCAASVSNI
jgi:hypothetical protein